MTDNERLVIIRRLRLLNKKTDEIKEEISALGDLIYEDYEDNWRVEASKIMNEKESGN